MNNILNKNIFLVKEHIGMFKAANNFDIFDPNTNEKILLCREDNLGIFTKLLRFTDYKRMTPFNVVLKTTANEKVLSVKRGIAFFKSTVQVFDENDNLARIFKQKFFSLGGKFELLDKNNINICTLQGKWTGWDFKFIKENIEFAHVSKKWAGIGKELFTSADNYVIEINENVPQNNSIRLMIIAAVMCIDMVLKE